MGNVRGRVVIITGGARGIGKATARRLLDEGARVAVCDLDQPVAEQTARELGGSGREIRAYPLDVRDPEAFRRTVEWVEADFGPVDVLINNAGIMPVGGFLEQPEGADRTQVEVNLLGVIHGMRAVLPRMRARGRGHVVNMASMAGKVPIPHAAVYSATKFAVVGLTESVRLELRGTGVELSYVMPVPVKTELLAGTARMRWPPPVEPEDVARAVLRAIERDRVEVFVPALQRLIAALPVLVPRRVSEWLSDVTGLTGMFRDTDHERRSAYVKRTTERGEPPVRVVS